MICVGIYRKIKTFFSASGVRFSDGQNGRASTQENLRTKPHISIRSSHRVKQRSSPNVTVLVVVG